MPTINLDAANLSADERRIADQIIGRGGRLRASKPKDGEAAYVWRMVAFQVSPNGQHHCMPMTADFGIKIDDFRARRARCVELDTMVKRIVDAVPMTRWHGVHRWGRAMGYNVGNFGGI